MAMTTRVTQDPRMMKIISTKMLKNIKIAFRAQGSITLRAPVGPSNEKARTKVQINLRGKRALSLAVTA